MPNFVKACPKRHTAFDPKTRKNNIHYPMNNKRLFMAALLALTMGAAAQAQDDSFDLSSQRGEKQDVNMVPGHKVDHQGIIVNPTPHALNVDRGNRLDLSAGVTLYDKQGKFASDIAFLRQAKKGVRLTVDYGERQARKAGLTRMVSGAYLLTVGKKGIDIVGYDERGAFYGLQTLRQILASPVSADGLPYLTCNDYPDLPDRGVVEGFYGNPWSHEVRLSLIDYYGRNKLNCYVYGPKDDPYHSSPNWRLPYPDNEARNIAELVEACRRARVDFVWAIHPGKDIKWNEEDYHNLVHKFDLMYDLGVRAFAIHFDDIDGEGTNPVRQVELVNRLTREFVKAKGDVAPLIVCPTDYSQLWAKPGPDGPLAIYGNQMDKDVRVFWTGEVVCSDLTPQTLDFVDQRIKRPALYWWNFPVTDYARHIVMQGPAYGLDTSLTDKQTCGVLSNPMEHGEASKLALYGTADYCWNVGVYNPIDNWERAIEDLTPEARDAYRTFAIHSTDTETGYRRAESWETETFRLDHYTQAQYDALAAELERVERVPAEMKAKCQNHLLMAELSPWLEEFGHLGTRALRALRLMQTYKSGDDQEFWSGYVANLMSKEERAKYEAHKSGTMKLQPFYENAMDDMASGFFRRLTGEVPAFYHGVGSYPTLRTTQNKLMFDNDTTTYYTSGTSQSTGDWIGADLGCVRPVREVRILQGRNSVDDVDYFDHAILEYSADGKTWTALTGELWRQYVVTWKGETVDARYLRLRKLESEKKNWASVRSFEVNPADASTLGFTIESSDETAALRAFDKNPCTAFALDGHVAFGVPEGKTCYTFLLALTDGQPLHVTQYDKRGKTIATTDITTPFFQLPVDKRTTRIALDGKAEVFEVMGE